MPFARSPRPEKPNLTAFSDRLLRLPAPSSARYAAFFVKEGGEGRTSPGSCGTGHKGNSGAPSRKDRARQHADPISAQPYSVGNVNYTERKIGICSPQKNRGRLPARKRKYCYKGSCSFCTKLWITYAHFLCASTLFLRCRPDLSTSVCTTAPDLCTISSFSVDRRRFRTSAYIFPQRRQYLPQAFRRRLYGLPLLPDKSGGGAFCPVRRDA